MKSKACFKRVLNIQQINVLRVFTFMKNRLVTEPRSSETDELSSLEAAAIVEKPAWRNILGAELDSDPRLLCRPDVSPGSVSERRPGNGLTRASE